MQRLLTRWHPQFRVATLFWLMAVVAAFFVGRRSDEIKVLASNWWEVTRVRFGGHVKPGYKVAYWPLGSLTISEDVPIQALVNNDPTVVYARLSTSRQLQVSPKSLGEATVSYSLPSGKYKSARLDLKIEPGQKHPNWTLEQQ